MSAGQIVLLVVCIFMGPFGWLLLFALWLAGIFEREKKEPKT